MGKVPVEDTNTEESIFWGGLQPVFGNQSYNKYKWNAPPEKHYVSVLLDMSGATRIIFQLISSASRSMQQCHGRCSRHGLCKQDACQPPVTIRKEELQDPRQEVRRIQHSSILSRLLP